MAKQRRIFISKFLSLLIFFCALFTLSYTLNPIPCPLVYAAIPHLINYQGRLTDKDNKPLEGSYALTFRIYDAETAGSLLWEETHSGVVIQKGIFSVLLGSVTSLNIPFDKPYFLEIKVGNEVMSPRQRITSAGYAIKAEEAEKAAQAKNADTIANIGVSALPAANKLLPLDVNAKLPVGALKVYDSGWFAVTTGTKYTKAHNLGTTKVILQIYYSNNPDGSGLCTLLGDNNYIGHYSWGTILNDLSNTTVSVRTASSTSGNAPYIFNGLDENGNGLAASSGYLRIIMIALE